MSFKKKKNIYILKNWKKKMKDRNSVKKGTVFQKEELFKKGDV